MTQIMVASVLVAFRIRTSRRHDNYSGLNHPRMASRRVPCRNFQSGSCHYGEHCRYSHSSPQQIKRDIFGFGSQSELKFQNSKLLQQNPTSVGFDIEDKNQHKAFINNESKQNQLKPFGNTWRRDSSLSDRNNDSNRQPSDHKCTDPDSCKRLIVEDLQHERPLWKLTCYGHYKSCPCDIVGDLSYEELRHVAYIDAKSGASMQSIVEKERSLFNSKKSEFDSLVASLKNAGGSSTVQAGSSGSPFTSGSKSPLSVSSFSQLGSSLIVGAGNRRLFGGNLVSSVDATAFEKGSCPPSSDEKASSVFGGSPFGSAGLRGSLSNSPFPAISSAIGSSFFNKKASVRVGSPQASISPSGQSAVTSTMPEPPKDDFGRIRLEPITSVDGSIWMKEEWDVGEIPEEAPPDAFIF